MTVLVVYGAALAAICCIFHTVSISLGFLVKIFGCLMGGGSFPMASIVLWDGTSTLAARWSPILALCSGLITWIVTTKARSGVITVTSLGDSYNSLAGDAVALGVGLITVVLLSLIFPDKKPFTIDGVACEDENTNAKELDKEENDPEKLQQDTSRPYNIEESADDAITSHFARKREPVVPVSALTPQQVRSQRTLAWSALAVGVLGFVIILPFTLYGTGYTFSLGFFKAYAIMAFIWIWSSAIICVGLPLWESRHVLAMIAKSAIRDMSVKSAERHR